MIWILFQILKWVEREKILSNTKSTKSFYPFKKLTAFVDFLKTYRHFVWSSKPICSVVLEDSLGNNRSIKFQISLHCEFLKENYILCEIENEAHQIYVNSELKVALNRHYLPKIFNLILNPNRYRWLETSIHKHTF